MKPNGTPAGGCVTMGKAGVTMESRQQPPSLRRERYVYSAGRIVDDGFVRPRFLALRLIDSRGRREIT